MVIFSASDCSSPPLLTLSRLGIVCTESCTIAAKWFWFVWAFFLPVLFKWMTIWHIDWPLFCVWHILVLQPGSKLPLPKVWSPLGKPKSRLAEKSYTCHPSGIHYVYIFISPHFKYGRKESLLLSAYQSCHDSCGISLS